MSEDHTQEMPPRPASAIVSYREFSKLNQQVAAISTKLDVALAQGEALHDHESRIVSLETERAVRDAKGGVYGRALDLLWGLALAIIAAGVWWPKH